jgi:hypothetical protein
VAAFTAAALSFVSVIVNVVLTYRLTSRAHREQWRREQERPIVARCLTLSREAQKEWLQASSAKHAGAEVEPHWQKGWQLLGDLSYEISQLDLLASHSVRVAADELFKAHARESSRIMRVRPGHDDAESRHASFAEMHRLQVALVERARTDLGIGPLSSRRPTASWASSLADLSDDGPGAVTMAVAGSGAW